MMHPQRWRLEALHEDGELDGEVCEKVPVEEKAIVGRLAGIGRANLEREAEQFLELEKEQRIELEVDEGVGQREAARFYGDVQDRHCQFIGMGDDFYAWALESKIGTLVDGKKYRQEDGPVPLRDGSVVGVGKYLLYC